MRYLKGATNCQNESATITQLQFHTLSRSKYGIFTDASVIYTDKTQSKKNVDKLNRFSFTPLVSTWKK